MRVTARRGLLAIALLAALTLVTPLRQGALRSLGSALVAGDPIQPADVGFVTDTGGAQEFQAAEIELADLFQQRTVSRAIVMRPTPEAIDDELARRGVKLADPAFDTLRQLGIPADRLDVLLTAEGGTTDSSQALAAWARTHPSRVLVIIGAAHSRRYRRTLQRIWPAGAPPPIVIYPRRSSFRPENWWQSRRSLREGVFELQKLLWDYVRHPW